MTDCPYCAPDEPCAMHNAAALYGGIPVHEVPEGVIPDDTMIVMSRPAFTERFLTEWKTPEQPRPFDRHQLDAYRYAMELMVRGFHHEPAWKVEQARAVRAREQLDRLTASEQFGRRWRTLLWTEIKCDWRAWWLRTWHPNRTVKVIDRADIGRITLT